ncbi:unnamed protein product [[Actinomadura] parvosata subsp. kistnae]|nr:unnamed protein product [Actinomadura parvosata subsp. kistnae]
MTRPSQLFTNEQLAGEFLADLNTLTTLTRPPASASALSS